MTSDQEDRLALETMRGGAVIEQFNDALQRVLENIVDPNTKPDAKRAVTLKVTFTPDEERDMMVIKSEVKATLAGDEALTGKAFVVQTRDGVSAVEHDPHQGRLDFDESEQVTPFRAASEGATE